MDLATEPGVADLPMRWPNDGVRVGAKFPDGAQRFNAEPKLLVVVIVALACVIERIDALNAVKDVAVPAITAAVAEECVRLILSVPRNPMVMRSQICHRAVHVLPSPHAADHCLPHK